MDTPAEPRKEAQLKPELKPEKRFPSDADSSSHKGAALPLRPSPRRKIPTFVVFSIVITILIVGVGFAVFLNLQKAQPETEDPHSNSNEPSAEFGLVIDEPIEIPATPSVPESQPDSSSEPSFIPVESNHQEGTSNPSSCLPEADPYLQSTISSLAEDQRHTAKSIAALGDAIFRIESALAAHTTAQVEMNRVVTGRLDTLAQPKTKTVTKKTVSPPFSLSSVSRWGQTTVALLTTKTGPYSAVLGADVSGWSVSKVDFEKQQITVTRRNRSLILSVEQ